MINLIKKYVNNLTINDIKNFAKNNNIYLTDNEVDNILYILKNDIDNLLTNSDGVFLKYKNSFTVENYNKIYILFNEYKKRYKNYLV